MRIWSLHPHLLDRAALVACWRETLLAQKVLRGLTKGYTRHPQLVRFRAASDPVAAVATYLSGIADEADRRGYRFDRTRIVICEPAAPEAVAANRLSVTTGQLEYEMAHLRAKVIARSPEWLPRLDDASTPPPTHPLFVTVDGPIEAWEVR